MVCCRLLSEKQENSDDGEAAPARIRSAGLMKNAALGSRPGLPGFFKCSHMVCIYPAFQKPSALPKEKNPVFQRLL